MPTFSFLIHPPYITIGLRVNENALLPFDKQACQSQRFGNRLNARLLLALYRLTSELLRTL